MEELRKTEEWQITEEDRQRTEAVKLHTRLEKHRWHKILLFIVICRMRKTKITCGAQILIKLQNIIECFILNFFSLLDLTKLVYLSCVDGWSVRCLCLFTVWNSDDPISLIEHSIACCFVRRFDVCDLFSRIFFACLTYYVSKSCFILSCTSERVFPLEILTELFRNLGALYFLLVSFLDEFKLWFNFICLVSYWTFFIVSTHIIIFYSANPYLKNYFKEILGLIPKILIVINITLSMNL
jgi:hypothetical protein